MGREVRRVPKGWEHPTDACGRLIPLHDGFSKRLATWHEENDQWSKGLRKDGKWNAETKTWEHEWIPIEDRYKDYDFEDWDGKCPHQDEYMPDWPEEERTHLQMYETTSEGTPISPVMKTPEELARWLADNGASAFASMTASYEDWLRTCKRGWACSAVKNAGEPLTSGVAGLRGKS